MKHGTENGLETRNRKTIPIPVPGNTGAAHGYTMGLSLRTVFFLLLIMTGGLCFTFGCEDQGAVGGGIFDPSISITTTDTLSLETATVLMDSVVTQDTGTILFGSYSDDFFGTVKASGYLGFSLGSVAFAPGEQARYDSLTLRMTPGYYYGDSTQSQHLRVHRVLEEIEPDEEEDLDNLYNFSSFAHDLHSLGEITFSPERDEKLEIGISDEIGMTLFEAAVNGDDIATSNEEFQDYLKGLVVIEANNESSTVITGVFSEGSVSEDEPEETSEANEIVLRLYYSDRDAGGNREETWYDFPLEAARTFTNIYSRKSGSLQQLEQANDLLKSTQSDAQVYIQSGIGLMGRVDLNDAAIENLHDLATYQMLLSAELLLFPIAGTYDFRTPLPEALSLYVADHRNRIIGELQQAAAEIDHEFHRETYYRFDITEFIFDRLQTEAFTVEGLLISTPPSLYDRSVDRVVLGDATKPGYRMLLIVTFVELNET